MAAYLNPFLLREQNVSLNDFFILQAAHSLKDSIFWLAERGTDPEVLLPLLEKVEVTMQEAWGFPRDASRHTWKYLMPNTPLTPEPGSWAEAYIGVVTNG